MPCKVVSNALNSKNWASNFHEKKPFQIEPSRLFTFRCLLQVIATRHVFMYVINDFNYVVLMMPFTQHYVFLVWTLVV
jgi:hypothetical protein